MRVGRSMVGWTVGFGNFGKWWNKSVTSLRVVKLEKTLREEAQMKGLTF
jgi:hypothetical protein